MTTAVAPMTLEAGLARLQLVLPAAAQQKLLDYIALTQKWNKVYNLTALRDAETMLTHHVLDSLAVVPPLLAHLPHVTSILDVGSGAGLPGIPLALALPQVSVTLLDSNHKKAAFLRQAVIELQLPNVEVICERVEKIEYNQRFSVVISRAFAALKEFICLASRFVAPGGTILAMKGAYPDEELADIPAGYRLSDLLQLQVPGLDARRTLLFLEAA